MKMLGRLTQKQKLANYDKLNEEADMYSNAVYDLVNGHFTAKKTYSCAWIRLNVDANYGDG